MKVQAWIRVALVGSLIGSGVIAQADPTPAPDAAKGDAAKAGEGKDQNKAKLKNSDDAMEALLIVTLKRDLGIETAEAADLAGKVKSLTDARRDFSKKQADAREELSKALQAASPDKAQIDKLMDGAFQAKIKFQTDYQKMFNDVTAGMDVVKKGKLYLSLDKFEDRVRRHMRQGGGMNGREGGGMRGERGERGDRIEKMREMREKRENRGTPGTGGAGGQR